MKYTDYTFKLVDAEILTYWLHLPNGFQSQCSFKQVIMVWSKTRTTTHNPPRAACGLRYYCLRRATAALVLRTLTLHVSEVQLQTCLSSPGLFHLLYNEWLTNFWPTVSQLASDPCNQGKSKTTKIEQHSRPPFLKRVT